MLPNLGMGELLIILALALLLFGAKKLPEAARGLGRSINTFKKGLKESEEEFKNSVETDAEKKSGKETESVES